uniref:Uncharacterized protein n=1 Tax=Kalanchoe fedtschenkoi TaxID=63787 RepID=A0A7N0U2S8_KALFE
MGSFLFQHPSQMVSHLADIPLRLLARSCIDNSSLRLLLPSGPASANCYLTGSIARCGSLPLQSACLS